MRNVGTSKCLVSQDRGKIHPLFVIPDHTTLEFFQSSLLFNISFSNAKHFQFFIFSAILGIAFLMKMVLSNSLHECTLSR